MRIRDATTDDLPRLVELLAQDDLGSQREEPHEPLAETYLDAFEAIHADPNNRIVVGEHRGSVVCMLQLTVLPHLTFNGGWRAQVEGVRVAEGNRGQGLGHELMAWAIQEARARGCHLVQLTTNKQRHQARQFYESLGFEPTHEGMKLYLAGGVDGA